MIPLIIYGNIFFMYVSKMVLSLNIISIKATKSIPKIVLVILCALTDFNGILLETVYMIIVKYT